MQPEEQPATAAGDPSAALLAMHKERTMWRTWAPWTFFVGFITAFVAVWASFGEQIHDVGVPPNFWIVVRTPGLMAIYFACFFGFAVFVSLVAHALLAYEGVNLLHFNVYVVEGVTIASFIMIFAFIATVGQCGPIWLILQIIVFLAYVITMGASSALFRTFGSDGPALLGAPWQQAVYYIYFSLSGIFRFGALVQCKNNRATSLLEEIAYWVLIVLHMGMYFALLAIKPIVLRGTVTSVDDAQLLNQMSNLTQFALTPLLLVHFEALSRARARSLIQEVERANKQLAVAQSAAEARREFIRYVFHEVRVPFNTIVLGLDELKAAAIEVGNKSMVADIKLMRTAADGMQQILNDTLTIEKMEAGTYLLELQPAHLPDVANTVVHSMQPWARDKQIALTADVSPDLPPWVLTDPNRLSQVLANFLSNALKFVDQRGHGRVEVLMFPVDKAVLETRAENETTTEIPEPAPPQPSAAHTVAVNVAGPVASVSASTPSNGTPRLRVAPPTPQPAVNTTIPAHAGFGAQVVSALARMHLTKLPSHQATGAQELTQVRAVEPHEATQVIRGGVLRSPTSTSRPQSTPRQQTADTQPAVVAPEYIGLQLPPDLPVTPPLSLLLPNQAAFPPPAITLTPSPRLALLSPLRIAQPSSVVQPVARSPGSILWVRIQVTDNGVGVTPDQQTRLWQPFSQIEAGIRQQGKGSGLGLHICKEIIRHHGGRVGVRSTPGLGSTFFADIPFQVCSAPSSDGLVSESGASSVAATHITPAPTVSTGDMLRPASAPAAATDHLVILVVDDVASNRVFLSRALKRQLPRSEVYEAEDGMQAVRMVTADLSKYHVVCMDKEMPVLDGYGATRELRKAGYRGVIIGVTANALSSDVQDYIAQGVNGVVTKPVDVPGLLDVIEQHISLPSTVPLPAAVAATRSRHESTGSWASDHRSMHADMSPHA